MRKIAAHRILLPRTQYGSRIVLYMHVVVLTNEGIVLRYYPLRGEEHGVEWYPGEVDLINFINFR